MTGWFLFLLQLISKAIITAARELHAQSHSSEDFSLSMPIVHVAHDAIEKRLSNLCHLIKCQPNIVTKLLQAIPPRESEMVRRYLSKNCCVIHLNQQNLRYLSMEVTLYCAKLPSWLCERGVWFAMKINWITRRKAVTRGDDKHACLTLKLAKMTINECFFFYCFAMLF